MMDSLNIHPLQFTPTVDNIVVTGGPCGGKSTLLSRALQKLQDMGITALVVPEIPTDLVVSGIMPGRTMPFQPFQHAILLATIEREYRYHQIMRAMTGKTKVILSDRGRMDGMAYMSSPKAFFAMAAQYGYTPADLCEHPYKAVLHLRSVAVDAPHLYTRANNVARRENAKDAAKVDAKVFNAWNGHPHLRVIGNLGEHGHLRGLDEKFKVFITHIAHTLGVPAPLEIEKKFHLKVMPEIPKDHETVEITQYYINGPEGQARIRSRTWRGVSVFYLTQKRELGPGVRYESERIISATEFANLIRFMEPGTRPVTKLRHTFVWKNQYFELDVFTGFYKGLILLEIELTDKNQKVSIPPFVKKPVEVTSAELFSNYAISKAANVKYYVSCPRR